MKTALHKILRIVGLGSAVLLVAWLYLPKPPV